METGNFPERYSGTFRNSGTTFRKPEIFRNNIPERSGTTFRKPENFPNDIPERYGTTFRKFPVYGEKIVPEIVPEFRISGTFSIMEMEIFFQKFKNLEDLKTFTFLFQNQPGLQFAFKLQRRGKLNYDFNFRPSSMKTVTLHLPV